MPEFSTWWIENGPTRSTLSPTSSVRPTTCFVSWSAMIAAAPTTTSANHCAGPAASERSAAEIGLQRVRGRADAHVHLLNLLRAGSLTAALQRPLVVDAERRVRHGLEPLLADRLAADAAGSVRAGLDPGERRLHLGRAGGRRSPRARRRARACTSRVALSAMWSPEPIERSPVSSISEPSWFTPSRAATSRSRSASSSRRKWSRSSVMQPPRGAAPPRSTSARGRGRPCRATPRR